MMHVLVDTSVWVDHFKETNPELSDLLEQDRVLTHPMIIGELACGTPPDRENLLAYFMNLQQPYVARLADMLDFVAKQKIYGCGCGFVDINVLLSARITPGVKIWTRDKRLAQLARTFDLSYLVAIH